MRATSSFERILLLCGVLSSLLYAVTNIVVPLQWEEYSVFSQTVSELSAIGAPTRTLWAVLMVPYGLLFIAFAVGVLRSARDHRALRVMAVLMLIGGVAGFFWPPMHLRETLAAGGGTLTDTLHIVFTGLWGLIVLVSMGLGASVLGLWFRLYTMASIIVTIAFGALTSLGAGGVSANLPTPWIGVWERINIATVMVWFAVFAIALLRIQQAADEGRLTKHTSHRAHAVTSGRGLA